MDVRLLDNAVAAVLGKMGVICPFDSVLNVPNPSGTDTIFQLSS
jgi:hypothetical protein